MFDFIETKADLHIKQEPHYAILVLTCISQMVVNVRCGIFVANGNVLKLNTQQTLYFFGQYIVNSATRVCIIKVGKITN